MTRWAREVAPALLERDSELDGVDEALRDASAGAGSLVLVQGPGGIGKTALLTEIRRRADAQGLSVLRARAQELEREFGFGVVRQLFEPVLARASPEQREQLLDGAAALAARPLGLLATPAEDTVVGHRRAVRRPPRAVLAHRERRRPPSRRHRRRRRTLGGWRLPALPRLPRPTPRRAAGGADPRRAGG